MGHNNKHYGLITNIGLNCCEILRQGLWPMLLEEYKKYVFFFKRRQIWKLLFTFVVFQ